MRWSIDHGDCREVLRSLDENSVDSCVTDGPYELGFMGKGWDRTGIAFQRDTWSLVLRVLKPGGHLLSFGGTRTYHRMACAVEDAGFEMRDTIDWLYGSGKPQSKNLLKPGHELICMARKPGGAGMLRIDDCRIHSGPSAGGATRNTALGRMNDDGWKPQTQSIDRSMAKGRWPANVIFDEDAASELDVQSGNRKSGAVKPGTFTKSLGYHGNAKGYVMPVVEASEGGASRFFYVAKASGRERNTGCAVGNDHPTVKPIALMRHLVRLVTPADGIVLDPFCGSGSTGVAALLEGLRFAGIEQSAEYVEIARQRLEHADREAA